MRDARTVIVCVNEGFQVLCPRGSIQHCVDVHAVEALLDPRQSVEIILNTDAQSFDRISLPRIRILDRWLYTYQKLKALNQGGMFGSLRIAEGLFFAGAIEDMQWPPLLAMLHRIQVRVASLRLFALELRSCLPAQTDTNAWQIVVVQEGDLIYVSAFKGSTLMFFRNTGPEELPLTLDYIHHHPSYYAEAIHIYRIQGDLEVPGASMLAIDNIYAALAAHRPVMNLFKSQGHARPFLRGLGVAVLGVWAGLGGQDLYHAYTRSQTVHVLESQIHHTTRRLAQMPGHDSAPAGVDVALIRAAGQVDLEREACDRAQMTQDFSRFGRLIAYTYTHNDQGLKLRQALLMPGRGAYASKQRQQILYALRRIAGTDALIDWREPAQLQIMGAP